MIIKKSAGLMTREEAEQLAKACDIYMVKDVRIERVSDKISNLGFFEDIGEAMKKFDDILGGEGFYEKISLDEGRENRRLEFYTIDPQDYNWVIDASNKLGHKLSLLQIVELGTEFDLDNLVALVPIETGMGKMPPVFKKSVITSFKKKIDGRGYIYPVNKEEVNFISGVGPFSTSLYSLREGKLYGGYNFKNLMAEGERIINQLGGSSLNIGFLGNARMLNSDEYFTKEKSSSSSTPESALVIDISNLNESLNKTRSLKLNLNYDFLDKYFSPQLKKQMTRKIRKFVTRRGDLPKSKQKFFGAYSDIAELMNEVLNVKIPLNELPHVVYVSEKGTFKGSGIVNFLESLLGLDNELETKQIPFSLSEEIEQEIVNKLEKGLSTYYENNGLTRPISALSGSANKFRGRVIRSIIEDAIASSLPGFSQPTGKQRGFRLEKSYRGMPVTLKDLSSSLTFNDVLKVMGKIPLYVNKTEKRELYDEELEKALNNMTSYFEAGFFNQFIDIAENPRFRLTAESSIKKIGSDKINYILKLADSSDVDIGMTTIFIFKFTLPDFNSNQTSYLTLEEANVERYTAKTSKSKYTVDINKVEDLNLEIADTVRRVYEIQPFFSSEQGLQARDSEGKRITTPIQTSKGLLQNVFREQSARENVIVLQEIKIDSLTGRYIGILFYPGISGDGIYVSIDDRKSGPVTTRTDAGEIFVVCSGQVYFEGNRRMDGQVSFNNPTVGASICSYGRPFTDFQQSFDSAATAFLISGGSKPEKLDNIVFQRAAQQPNNIAHLEVEAGQTIKREYMLMTEGYSHDFIQQSNPNLTGIEILPVDRETLEETIMSASGLDGDVLAMTLRCQVNVYQKVFSMRLICHLELSNGDYETVNSQGFFEGTLDSGNFIGISPNVDTIINTEQIMVRIIDDFKNQVELIATRLKTFTEGVGKDKLTAMIKQKAFGHELGATRDRGQQLATTRFRGITDEQENKK